MFGLDYFYYCITVVTFFPITLMRNFGSKCTYFFPNFYLNVLNILHNVKNLNSPKFFSAENIYLIYFEVNVPVRFT